MNAILATAPMPRPAGPFPLLAMRDAIRQTLPHLTPAIPDRDADNLVRAICAALAANITPEMEAAYNRTRFGPEDIHKDRRAIAEAIRSLHK